MLSQQEICDLILPYIRQHGIQYRKFKKIYAREAQEGEEIVTATQDGVETINIAHTGDYVVQNQTKSGEEYIVSPSTFNKRYVFNRELENTNYKEYNPIGKVMGIELTQEVLAILDQEEEFYFMASWGEPMRACLRDFLVAPLEKIQVYRIARQEFFETYERDLSFLKE